MKQMRITNQLVQSLQMAAELRGRFNGFNEFRVTVFIKQHQYGIMLKSNFVLALACMD
jgi:hypothetical protein